MLDMGFIDDIEAIIAATPASRQTMHSRPRSTARSVR
jgi:superfamily II DNA/RNA helicase